jgi:hypothetical protein
MAKFKDRNLQLHIDNINFRVHNLCQAKGFKKIQNVVQGGIDMTPIIAHRSHPQLNLLPLIIGAHFGNGRIELGLHLIDHTPDDFSFPLERPIVKKEKLDLQSTDHHDY